MNLFDQGIMSLVLLQLDFTNQALDVTLWSTEELNLSENEVPNELRISDNSSISHSSNVYPSQLKLQPEALRRVRKSCCSSCKLFWKPALAIHVAPLRSHHKNCCAGSPAETRRSKRSKRWVTFPSSSSRCSKELWQCRHDTNRTSVTGESKRRMKGCQTLLHDLGVPKMKMYAPMIYDRQARQETKSAEKCLCQPKPFRFLRTGRVLRFNTCYEQCLVHVACAAREPGRKKSLHRLPPMLAKSHRIIRASPRESSQKRCFNCIFWYYGTSIHKYPVHVCCCLVPIS